MCDYLLFQQFRLILQYLQGATHYHERKTHKQDTALSEMRRCREIVVKELSDTKTKLQKALKENDELRKELMWKPENPVSIFRF